MIFLAYVIFLYLSIVGITCSKYKPSQPKFNRLYYFTALILIIFAGFRPIGIDQDSVGYLRYYNLAERAWAFVEPTYCLISIFIKKTFNDFRLILIIYATIGILLKFRAFKSLTDLIWQTVLIYFSTYFLLHDFTQIRAAVVSGIFLISLKYLAAGKRIKYIIFCLISILFHFSSVVLLPLALLGNKKLSKRWIIMLGLLIPFGILLHYIGFSPMVSIGNEMAQTKIDTYQKAAADTNISLNVFNLVYIVKYTLFYTFLIFSKRLSQYNKYFPLLLKIFGVSLFSYLALSQNTIYAMRISELLGVVEIILIPLIIFITPQRSFGKFIVWFIALSYLLINIYSLELIYSEPKIDY